MEEIDCDVPDALPAYTINACDGYEVDVLPVALETSGLIIVDREARLRYASAEALRLLVLAIHPHLSAQVITALGSSIILQAVILQVCGKLVGAFEGKQAAAEAAWHHTNPWGTFGFRAYCLDDGGLNDGGPACKPLVGITIQYEMSLAVKVMARLKRFHLSRRQTEICLLIAADHSRAELARRMGISEHTVVTHIRRIYEKLGVQSRAELMSKLLEDYCGAATD
jgi:DNA-binding CsgD family transcriptional regulator